MDAWITSQELIVLLLGMSRDWEVTRNLLVLEVMVTAGDVSESGSIIEHDRSVE